MTVREKYREIEERKAAAARRAGRDPDEVLLLAVTKLHTAEEINEAITAGATDIGENRVQELLAKYEEVKPVRWHLIGHLQTNKVRQIIDKVVMIHSVDSQKLAREIDKRAAGADRIMDILIEVNVAGEDTKTGVAVSELEPLAREIVEECGHLRLRGIMCIPPPAREPEEARRFFREIRTQLEHLRTLGFSPKQAPLDTLSMGMSGDFEVAIEEGATVVRVGSAIFGKRDYR